MSQFENILDMAAATALNAFRLTGQYFYEDRKTGSRHPVQCIEQTIQLVEEDNNGATIVRTGKGFLISRADRDAVDAWRKEMNIDVQKEPTPFGGDYMVRVMGEQTEKYEITYREPYTVIGTNRTLYRINTIFVRKTTKTVSTIPPSGGGNGTSCNCPPNHSGENNTGNIETLDSTTINQILTSTGFPTTT